MRGISLFIILIFISVSQCSLPKPWMNIRDTPSERAHELLAQMEFSEKLAMVAGHDGVSPYVGFIPNNTRLGIPALTLEDGPQGVADGVKLATCFPSALTVTASWDVNAMEQFAAAAAYEQRVKGTNVMLGPMVNIARVPMGGRNFESMGEDPYLAARMCAMNVRGIQSQGVIAVVKHFANNNQEYDRTTVSANVDQRTQYEVYYPAFKAAIDEGVGSVMCSYNKINDTWACENNQALNIDLKKNMGFQGWVMSDWGATHSSVYAAMNGLDQQMPDDSHFGTTLRQAIVEGVMPMSRLDDMVLRILTPMFAVGLFDNPQTGDLKVNATSDEHNNLAKTLAQQSTVLAKNAMNLLPLKPNSKIAVIGDAGHDSPIVAGGGSGHVIPPYVISPFTGIQNRASSPSNVIYANSSSIPAAIQAAQKSDVAIVVVGVTSAEGEDRKDLNLQANDNTLIKAIAAVQKNIIVVVNCPSAVLMPWVDQVKSILINFMSGQESGNALAAVVFGDVNPSGKLPVTFPLNQADIPVNKPSQYPGEDDESYYSEQLNVGYRWYDANKKVPLFPFGHGLSYTTFSYGNATVTGSIYSNLQVSLEIRNTGTVGGSEVVQLYLGFPSQAREPPKLLKGFMKVHVGANQAKRITFTLNTNSIGVWDTPSQNWKTVKGQYQVFIGSSATDIRQTTSFNAA